MTDRRTRIANSSKDRALASLAILFASTEKYRCYDPARTYSPDEREYYDALCDRFLRAIETCLKFFRSYERLQYGENSDTLRDLLNRMHKTAIISAPISWLDMRELRNRIAHDYLPEQLQDLYQRIYSSATTELQSLQRTLQALDLKEK